MHFKKAFQFFLFTSTYIAFCAIGMVYLTQQLFGIGNDLPFYSFVFAGTLCSYNFHWFLTPPADEGPVSVKNQWNISNRRVHLVIALLALVAAAYFFLLLKKHFIWIMGAGLITFLYSAPKIPHEKTRWLRNIAYGKTIFLALAWTYITTMLPLLVHDAAWTQAQYLFCLNRFFLIYAICILFDLRDRDRDRKEGIRSLVTQLPIRAVHFLYWSVIVIFYITCILLARHFTAATILALAVPGLIITIFYKRFLQETSDFVYYFILDGLMVFSLPLLLIFRI